MILGEYSFSDSAELSSLAEHHRLAERYKDVEFHKTECRGFYGGYFLNTLLPYGPDDFFFYDPEKDIFVLFSGTVYNRSDFFSGHNIGPSVSDPELVARLFLKEGPDFVKELNGDFSFFVLRPAGGRAYLYRDHAGIRPLAYSTYQGKLVFSSDNIELSRALPGTQHSDTEYLLGYFKYIDYRRTPDRRVQKLTPGHYLEFSGQGVRLVKYWDPGNIKPDRSLSWEKMISDLKSLVHDSVTVRCDRRFIAGADVSSGLDSGIVSLLARKEYSHQQSFYGFSWSPDQYDASGVEYDEREIVNSFCRKSDITPVFADMNEDDFSRFVSRFYFNRGYFSSDKTIEQALRLHTNLIFSGWGGDEFISTGDRGIEADLLRGLHFKIFFRRNPVKNPRKFIKWFLFYVIYPALGILDKATARSFRNDARYLEKPFRQSDRKALRNFYFHTSRRQLHLRLLQFYHLQERCESWAINGFCNGVEYRFPLLDRRIIEYILKVPSLLLCRTEHFRPLLREIGEDILPDEVRWQLLKNDPVYWSFMNDLFRKSALRYLDEIDTWKSNPALHFVNFRLLSCDIDKYRLSPGEVNEKILFRALVYLKALHEFTVCYRGK